MILAEKRQLIKACSVDYNEFKSDEEPRWSGRFTLNIEGFEIKGRTEHFATPEQALTETKRLVSEAVAKFV